MKLTSRWSGGRIFWRVFGPKDTFYAVGRWEGYLSFGETATFNLPEGSLQLEIKRDGLFGPFIVRPGQVWSNNEDRILNNQGELVTPDMAEPLSAATAELDVAIEYVFVGQKRETEHVTREIRFSGGADQKTLDIDGFDIIRDVKISVSALHGSFIESTGEMSLSAEVSVAYGAIVAHASVGLTTGSASSGPTFSGTGSPLDRGTHAFKLVGGGALTSPIATEFFVTVNGTLTSAPTPRARTR